MSALALRADARRLPLPDASVDLVVTSPPYFGLRSYTDNGEHYDGQIGSEATPAEWLASLVECTREWVRVLKPSGSIFVNLGDKYGGNQPAKGARIQKPWQQPHDQVRRPTTPPSRTGHPPKSLLGLPWRYALACMDELGLILRRDIIWSKPNGLPESVTDRCRSSHEYVFHLVRQPRYYAAVDEIREPHTATLTGRSTAGWHAGPSGNREIGRGQFGNGVRDFATSPLGKLPGSVWEIPSQPLKVPESLGVDHFACVDAETEILTPAGWLRHDQLRPGDQVAGYDLDTNMARWTDYTAVNRYDYDGDMIAVESRDLSMRLTPNHRTIVQRMHGRAHRRSPVSVVRADELDYRHFIPRSAAWEQFGHVQIGAREAAILGWVAAEGWYQGTGVWLSQSLDVNAPNVAEIDNLIPDAARTERKRTYKGQPWTEVTWKLGQAGAVAQWNMPDKLLPWWFVSATEGERRAVLDAFIAGDGHRRPDGRISIFQKLRHNLDVLQAVAVTLGYKTTLREGGGRFVLYLTEGGRSVTLRGTSGVGSKVKREHYKGTVWCPTTGTGTFIARRNGSVFVTGNSFPLELPRRIIAGWSPPGICTACGEGRRAVTRVSYVDVPGGSAQAMQNCRKWEAGGVRGSLPGRAAAAATITGYACGCSQDVPRPESADSPEQRSGVFADRSGERSGTGPGHLPPTTPAIVLDPFAGTGTTMLAASALGRVGIGCDLSMDYARLARWRTQDRGEIAKAMQVPKPPVQSDGQDALFAL